MSTWAAFFIFTPEFIGVKDVFSVRAFTLLPMHGAGSA